MIQVQTTQLNKFKQFIGFPVVTLTARRSQVSEVLLLLVGSPISPFAQC